MVDTLGVVELDSAKQSWSLAQESHRLARRRFGDQTLLQWMVRRLSEAALIDHVVVVADTTARDSVVHDLPTDVEIWAESGDPLSRIACTVRRFQALLFLQ